MNGQVTIGFEGPDEHWLDLTIAEENVSIVIGEIFITGEDAKRIKRAMDALKAATCTLKEKPCIDCQCDVVRSETAGWSPWTTTTLDLEF